jgi:ABC-type sugar transport system ATPase subunit
MKAPSWANSSIGASSYSLDGQFLKSQDALKHCAGEQFLIAVQNLSLRQGAFSLSNISFTIPTGKYGVLMGPTGCGKTSILEAICGLRPLHSGSIFLGETQIDRLPPAARGIGYVPQDVALFPTLTVRQHLEFALTVRRVPQFEIDKRVTDMATWLNISGLLDRHPAGLSGGEAQRVALGRALSFRPKFLLMDEPLSSVDETTRGQLIDLLLDIRGCGDITVLHVTHFRAEALRLADVLFNLEDGQIPGEIQGGD